MQLKSLDESLATIAAVKDLAAKLDEVLGDLRPALAKLPNDLRDTVTMEIHDVVDVWLAEIDGSAASLKTNTAEPMSNQKPKVEKGSLAAQAHGIIKTCGSLTMSQLINECKQRNVAGAMTDGFRATLNTALYRRKDVFERKGNFIHLRANDIELV